MKLASAGVCLDGQDLTDKCKRKPDVLAAILAKDRSFPHPTARRILYEDFSSKHFELSQRREEFKRHLESLEQVRKQKKARPLATPVRALAALEDGDPENPEAQRHVKMLTEAQKGLMKTKHLPD